MLPIVSVEDASTINPFPRDTAQLRITPLFEPTKAPTVSKLLLLETSAAVISSSTLKIREVIVVSPNKPTFTPLVEFSVRPVIL